MTIKLYEDDSYIRDFSARVLSWDNSGCVLDKTAFFPEGGGQYGDTGFINGIRVTDTKIKDGIIYHITEDIGDIGECKCNIDWSVRYNRMQNHTGEHILSGVIHSKFGYNNVGFHLSDEEVTLDIDGKLTENDIEMLEDTVNSIIDKNREVSVIYPQGKELNELEYRSKLDLTEGVRIVIIDGVDKCACCAPHVKSTAEVGLLKIVKHYNYKNGTRIHILCGDFARRDYRILSDLNTRIVNASSAKRYELTDIFDRKEAEIFALKEELKAFKTSAIKKAVTAQANNKTVYCYFEDNFTMDDLVRMADFSVQRHPDALSAVFCGNDDDGYNFVIGGKGAKDRFADFRAKFNARGGGREMYQGKVQSVKSQLLSYFS